MDRYEYAAAVDFARMTGAARDRFDLFLSGPQVRELLRLHAAEAGATPAAPGRNVRATHHALHSKGLLVPGHGGPALSAAGRAMVAVLRLAGHAPSPGPAR